MKNRVKNIIGTIKNNLCNLLMKAKKKFSIIIVSLKKITIFLGKYIMIPILFLLIFLVTPIVLEKIINLLIKKDIIMENHMLNYIGFYISLLSGIFTLLGVMLTIKYESNKKKKDDIIKYKPILSIDGTNLPKNCLVREVGLSMPYNRLNDDSNLEEKFQLQMNSNNPKYRLYIRNKGRGETYNAVLDKLQLSKVNWDQNTNLYSNIGGNQYIGEILKDEYLGIDVNFPNYLFMPEKKEGLLWYELRTNIIISYSDMFDKIQYQYNLHVIHKVYIDKFENDEPYHYKDGFRYAKVHYEIINMIPEMKIYSKKQKRYIYDFEYVKENND